MKMVIFTFCIFIGLPAFIGYFTYDVLQRKHHELLFMFTVLLSCIPLGFAMFNYLEVEDPLGKRNIKRN